MNGVLSMGAQVLTHAMMARNNSNHEQIIQQNTLGKSKCI